MFDAFALTVCYRGWLIDWTEAGMFDAFALTVAYRGWLIDWTKEGMFDAFALNVSCSSCRGDRAIEQKWERAFAGLAVEVDWSIEQKREFFYAFALTVRCRGLLIDCTKKAMIDAFALTVRCRGWLIDRTKNGMFHAFALTVSCSSCRSDWAIEQKEGTIDAFALTVSCRRWLIDKTKNECLMHLLWSLAVVAVVVTERLNKRGNGWCICFNC